VISGQKLKAYCIMHTILRNKLHKPLNMSQFLLANGMPESTKATVRGQSGSSTQSVEYYDGLKDLIVKRPDPLLSFGFFFPLNGLPSINKYTCKGINATLREVAAEYLTRSIIVRDDYNLIVLPKLVKWYRRDYFAASFSFNEHSSDDERIRLLRSLNQL
jgi:Protein of unknown function, DUF547